MLEHERCIWEKTVWAELSLLGSEQGVWDKIWLFRSITNLTSLHEAVATD